MAVCIDCGTRVPALHRRCLACIERANGLAQRFFHRCCRCGTVAEPKKKSLPMWLGFVLLLFYIIPGLLYFAAAIFTSKTVCPKCESTELVPVDALEPPIAAPERISCRECGESIPRLARTCRFCGTPLVHVAH